MSSNCYSYKTLTSLEFSRQIFEEYSNIVVMEFCSVGAELFHADGQTDRETGSRPYEDNNRFSQFCERA